MKHFFLLVSFVFIIPIHSQTFSSLNISLVGLIAPNNDPVASPVGNKYSGCWGWYQASKNKEYGISGASNGTYFIDITNPATPSVSAFVAGWRKGCTWREIKTYKNYCYISSDDAAPNSFQIIDMQYLPDSVHILHNSTTYIERGHTLWVDSNKLYVGAATFSAGFAPMAIFSLATPSAPALLKRLEDDIPVTLINFVHDMYVRNDTIFASAGNQGLYVLKYNTVTNSLTVLGSYTGYAAAGYNHSSFLTKDGKYLMFCDEVPTSLPIHMVDVRNPANIQPLQTFYPASYTTPHNPYMIGNDFAIVSCYQDGLFIYDISQPQKIKQVGFFDTYPQGGVNTGIYDSNAYSGNWGAYPFLPSGLIVANDMQNGMFILNPAAAYTTNIKTDVNATGIKKNHYLPSALLLYPNPANSIININLLAEGQSVLEIRNLLGELIYSKVFYGPITDSIPTHQINNGLYCLTVNNQNFSVNKKLQIKH